MKYLLLTVVFLIPYCQSLSGQKEYKEEFLKEYEWRIKQPRLDGVYIPKDLDDAFIELKRLSDQGSIEKFKNAPEDLVVRKLHFGLGKWIIINWGLYEGSRYGHYLKGLGLSHPDDMARLTIRLYHRHLNQKNLNTGEEVEKLVRQRREMLEAKKDTIGRLN